MSSKKQEVRSRKSVADLRSKSIDELQKLLAIARADLLEAQKSLKANELANPRVVGKFKKEIAQILTVMHEMSNEKDNKKASEAQPSTNSRAKRSVAPSIGAGEVL